MEWELFNGLKLAESIIIIGSILGSIKANFNDKETKPIYTRIINIILGIFCGVLVGFHFENTNLLWFNGLVSITVSMLSVSILDTLYLITPIVTKFIIKLRLGIKNDL